MKYLEVINAKLSRSTKGISVQFENNWFFFSFEILHNYDIASVNDFLGKIVEFDEKNEINRKNHWFFPRHHNIIAIKIANANVIEKIKKIDKEKNKKLLETFIEENQEEKNLETNDVKIDFNSIYKNIPHYEIKESKTKMDAIDKLIEKSIKLTRSKYNNGPIRNNDYNFKTLYDLAGNDLLEFITGKTTSLTILVPKSPKIPKAISEDIEKIIEYTTKKWEQYITKSDINLLRKETLSSADYILKIKKRRELKFQKLKRIALMANKIKHQTGRTPLSIAWPFVVGKTIKGTLIHAPIAFQNIVIEETLNSYKLTKESLFLTNTYPILKNYVDNGSRVNKIEPEIENLKDLLIHFFKHGIKIAKPNSEELINYEQIKAGSNEEKVFVNDFYKLSNEVVFKIKSHDELIYYDLQDIKDNYGSFSVPAINLKIMEDKEVFRDRNYIVDVDNSKAKAISKAIEESSVIFGPPGTGKSKAITGIIGEIIKNDHNSIMVAEKAVALDVIEKNLREIQMDSFTVNLNNNSKYDFVEKFNKQLSILINRYNVMDKKIKKVNFVDLWKVLYVRITI